MLPITTSAHEPIAGGSTVSSTTRRPDARERNRADRGARLAARFHGRSVRRNRLRFDWLEDRTLLAAFVVSNTDDSGPGSLRQAILDANADTGSDVIDFDIPGIAVHTIMPKSELPAITDSVLIDGW